MKKEERKSNFELLRIVCMFGIMMIHYLRHGINIENNLITTNRIIYELLSFTGRFGVLCLVMITGYFMIDKKFDIKKIVLLLIQVSFYSTVIYLICSITGITSFSIKKLIYAIFPTLFKQYWFIPCYVVLYIFSPFINKMANNITKKQYQTLIITLIFLFSIIPLITLRRWVTTTEFYQEIWIFILMYLIAGYIKLYPSKYFSN